MIPYEDLCAALDRYTQRNPHEAPAPIAAVEDSAFPPPDPPTNEHALPPVALGGGEDDHTNVGVQPIYDDRSNEIDINDVLSDEEGPKH